jgi:chromosome segregation ATPase
MILGLLTAGLAVCTVGLAIELANYHTLVRGLRNTVKDLEGACNHKDYTIEDLKNLLETEKEASKTNNDLLNMRCEEVEELKKDCNKEHLRLLETSNELSEMKRTRCKVLADISDVESKNRELMEKIDNLEKDNGSVRELLSAEEVLSKGLKAKIDELYKKIEEMDANRLVQIDIIEAKDKRIEELNDSLKFEVERVSSLTNEIKSLRANTKLDEELCEENKKLSKKLEEAEHKAMVSSEVSNAQSRKLSELSKVIGNENPTQFGIVRNGVHDYCVYAYFKKVKAPVLIKTFATEDKDYNLGLAEELKEKLEEKI